MIGEHSYIYPKSKPENRTLKNTNYLRVVLFALAILPALFIGFYIVRYGVNVPFLDQWGVAPYIYRYLTHFNIPFNDLIAQQNESRPVFPRFIFAFAAYLTHWDVRYEMVMMLFIACTISFNIYRLNKLTVGGGILKGLLILLALNILIFSPTQYENWLWGIQIIVFIPMLCITASILVTYSQISPGLKYIICICLATISTYSYANGLLCWVVVLPVLVFNTWQYLQKQKWVAISWLSAFIINVYLYFYNYKKPVHHPNLLAVANPMDAVDYFLCFLGSPFAFGKLSTAKLVGLGLVIAWMAIGIYLIRFRKDYTLWHRSIGWLAIASYTLISALVTTFGRVGFGVGQAMAPRYTTFSLYLAISLIPMLAIIIDDFIARGYLPKKQQLVRGTSLFLVIILLYFHANSASIAVKMMGDWKIERLQGKACLMFINVLTEKDCIEKKVYSNIEVVNNLANKVDSIGLLNPSLLTSNKIKGIQGRVLPNSEPYGWFDALTKVSENEYLASGWAVLPFRKVNADAVILTYENPKKKEKAFALSDTIVPRKDVVKFSKNRGYLMSGWQKKFSASRLPKGNVKINAWAFDTNTGKAFKLNQTQIIENQ